MCSRFTKIFLDFFINLRNNLSSINSYQNKQDNIKKFTRISFYFSIHHLRNNSSLTDRYQNKQDKITTFTWISFYFRFFFVNFNMTDHQLPLVSSYCLQRWFARITPGVMAQGHSTIAPCLPNVLGQLLLSRWHSLLTHNSMCIIKQIISITVWKTLIY